MNIDLKRLLQATKGPIIELAGPTPEGYKLLQQHQLELPESTIITNQSLLVPDNPFAGNDIIYDADEVADIIALPYEDRSVAFYFASYIPLTPVSGPGIKNKKV